MNEDALEAVLKEQEDAEESVRQLLPAWFTNRMVDDVWYFGLRLITGEMLGVATLNRIQAASGMVWLDVTLLTATEVAGLGPVKITRSVVGAPTSRTTASINAAHVVYAVELADT